MGRPRKIEHQGTVYNSITELAEMHGLPRTTVRDRIYNGDNDVCRDRYTKDLDQVGA